MSEEQHPTTIGDVLTEFGGEVKTGPFGTALKASEYTNSGVPVISVGEIGHGVIHLHDRTPFVDEAVTTRLPEYVLREGDIVFARKGSVDRTALIGQREAGWFLGSDGIRLRLPSTVSSRFVRYWIGSPIVRDWLIQNSTGSTMASLNQATIKRLPISLPNLKTQISISRTLGALDDKIELNRRMSATLEEMARALYRSWFVDFDPVHARALGQPPAHMDAATAALFPDSFGPDGLPKGWDMSTIGEVAETGGGATPKTKEPSFWDGPHRWATPRDLSKLGQPVLFETDRTLTDAGLAKISSGLSPAGTVLLSSRAPIGYVAIAQNPVAVNQGFIALRETARISSVEAYFWVQSNMDAILANANGSTFQEISKKNFRPLPCVVAPDPVRSAFRDLAGTWFDRVAGLCAESANLAALRDALLPRLMSGELRIRDAEKQVEEVV
ncbi:restriction endonuclease subunit S [Thioclava nitratireducens]|uniref:Restriction endonuclease subunit S n=1 Tax=Thioclava nitratireducens TaxID=1915078 RepID=A0ABN4XFI5_9RHOB|nr:restriction endonuclease subunit S [Thioclava nitratireducens]AQS48193.1 restriction endonuclease subunit S [Thioclava nitratireducens]